MLGIYPYSWLLIVNLSTNEIKAYLTHQLLFQILKNYPKSSIKAYMNDTKSIWLSDSIWLKISGKDKNAFHKLKWQQTVM